ncbi:MAG: hypothetical protein J0H74_01150 [Chitinophagaceae bacterium]|nr:hypothetical protein [Chitinophagaceae bacterium]
MELEGYKIKREEGNFIYWFYSEGPKGKIIKTIQFQHMLEYGKDFFNLAFGDVDEHTGGLNDKPITNNGDYQKVLLTVAKVVLNFINFWPRAIIQVKGNTLSRTRLYQMGIGAFWLDISQEVDILGELNGDWVPFKKGVNYTGFLVFKKIR